MVLHTNETHIFRTLVSILPWKELSWSKNIHGRRPNEEQQEEGSPPKIKSPEKQTAINSPPRSKREGSSIHAANRRVRGLLTAKNNRTKSTPKSQTIAIKLGFITFQRNQSTSGWICAALQSSRAGEGSKWRASGKRPGAGGGSSAIQRRGFARGRRGSGKTHQNFRLVWIHIQKICHTHRYR